MPVQYAIALFDNFLSTALEFSARLPAPITGVLLIAIGVCIYETLGNSRAPGNWR